MAQVPLCVAVDAADGATLARAITACTVVVTMVVASKYLAASKSPTAVGRGTSHTGGHV